jgi:hypothetical protein
MHTEQDKHTDKQDSQIQSTLESTEPYERPRLTRHGNLTRLTEGIEGDPEDGLEGAVSL